MSRFLISLLILITILIINIFTGCGGLFRPQLPLPGINPDILVNQIQKHASQLRTFQGRARVTVVSSEGSFGGLMRVAAKPPDSLWLKLEGPLGIDIGTARFSGKDVLFYNPWDNVAYEGSVQKMRRAQILPLIMNHSGLVLGLLVPMLDSLQNLSTDGKRYVLGFGNGELIWAEPKGPVVTKWERRDFNGEIQWMWEGERFQSKKGIRLPRIIRVTGYNPKQRITLFYENIKANRPLKRGWCKIKIPEGVEYIEL
jgi:hypothetical protein